MNWWGLSKTAQWGNKDPVQADPAEVGYKPEWGDHHGPVSYVPDTWNYSRKGYPDRSPPMPLAKKMYHVTPFPNEILREGFKTFENPNDQVFGGHGTYVSFTNLADAKTYQQALRTVWEVANGMIDESDIPNLAKTWGVKPDAAARYWEEVKRTAEVHKNAGYPMTFQNMVMEYLQKIGFTMEHNRFPNSPKFPLFVGTGKSLMQKLQGVDGRNIAILEAEPNPLQWHNGVNVFDRSQMNDKYTYNGNENEWRIWNPQHIPKEKIRRVL